MTTLAGNVTGPIVVEEDTLVSGNLVGDAVVRAGRTFRLAGNMRGDIVLEGDGGAEVVGNHAGSVIRAEAV